MARGFLDAGVLERLVGGKVGENEGVWVGMSRGYGFCEGLE